MTFERQERQIAPTHPGEMLREDFLPDYGLTTSSLAVALGVSRQTVSELLSEKRRLSSKMALLLARLFGNSAEFWLNAQQACDLWTLRNQYKHELSRIRPIVLA